MEIAVTFAEQSMAIGVEMEEQNEEMVMAVDETMTLVGPPGKSAYEVAVDNGFSGTESAWLSSLKGEPGKNGKEGYTPVKGVDYFDGKNGYTPVKGTDYFTTDDKAEMVAAVIDALPVYDGSVVSV